VGSNTRNIRNNRNRDYYLRNREKLLSYYHVRYLANKDDILKQKQEYNSRPQVKKHSSEYHKKYYLEHKSEINQQHNEYLKKKKQKG
jgi:hypothetical protein